MYILDTYNMTFFCITKMKILGLRQKRLVPHKVNMNGSCNYTNEGDDGTILIYKKMWCN